MHICHRFETIVFDKTEKESNNHRHVDGSSPILWCQRFKQRSRHFLATRVPAGIAAFLRPATRATPRPCQPGCPDALSCRRLFQHRCSKQRSWWVSPRQEGLLCRAYHYFRVRHSCMEDHPSESSESRAAAGTIFEIFVAGAAWRKKPSDLSHPSQCASGEALFESVQSSESSGSPERVLVSLI